MDRLLRQPATVLASMIRDRQVSSREVLEAHLAQIERVNPTVNAVVERRFEAARSEADAADAAVARGDDLAAFHGVPCTIKESFALTGMPWTAGLVSRKSIRALSDAPTVARLRKAGAIPMGVTNTSELCMWMESVNHVYGRTTGAYDPSRIAGGSSGGEGAAVGSAMSPFGLGSDIGGSIRLPAFFNGVFGHKPSGCMVPATGQFPAPRGTANRMLATGPLCRSARDLHPLLEVLAGPDGEDLDCQPFSLVDPSSVDLRDVTIFDVQASGSFGAKIDTALLDAQDKAVHALAKRGARVVSTRLPALKDAFEIWSAAMHEGNAVSFGELLGGGDAITPMKALWGLPAAFQGKPPYTVAALALCLAEVLPVMMKGRREGLLKKRAELVASMRAMLGERGVMLLPTFTKIAPKHHEPLTQFLDVGVTGIINVLELPATAVPMGLDARGLPMGLQAIGPYGFDHLPLAVGLALEEACGGWVPPPRWS